MARKTRKSRKSRRAPRADRHVYVIDLDRFVLTKKGFAKKNPDYVEGKPCVYVGMSAHEPRVRYEQHKRGYKPNRFAKRFGQYVRAKRCRAGLTWKQAVAAEVAVAERLRRKGWAVWQN